MGMSLGGVLVKICLFLAPSYDDLVCYKSISRTFFIWCFEVLHNNCFFLVMKQDIDVISIRYQTLVSFFGGFLFLFLSNVVDVVMLLLFLSWMRTLTSSSESLKQHHMLVASLLFFSKTWLLLSHTLAHTHPHPPTHPPFGADIPFFIKSFRKLEVFLQRSQHLITSFKLQRGGHQQSKEKQHSTSGSGVGGLIFVRS